MTEMEDVPIAEEAPASASINDVENSVEVEQVPPTPVAVSTNKDTQVENNVEENSSDDEEATNKSCGSKYCGWANYHGVTEAKGYAILGTARGAIVMSNIFLSTSLIYLATEEAGCIDENGVAIPDCDNTVRGFQPASLIANIAVISGLLSAFFMPFIGAIVDYTPYRRAMGIIAALIMILVQGVQVSYHSRICLSRWWLHDEWQIRSTHTSLPVSPPALCFLDWNRFRHVVSHGCTSSDCRLYLSGRSTGHVCLSTRDCSCGRRNDHDQVHVIVCHAAV